MATGEIPGTVSSRPPPGFRIRCSVRSAAGGSKISCSVCVRMIASKPHPMSGVDSLTPAEVAGLVEQRGVAKSKASIQTTFDLYGHLMPGNEDEAVALVDAYLERSNTTTRLAQID